VGYGHESNQSENQRFRDACKAAGLDSSEMDRFSAVYHRRSSSERERMSFSEIKAEAAEWKQNNGGGYRRSDR
jgi:hypothetical protein